MPSSAFDTAELNLYEQTTSGTKWKPTIATFFRVLLKIMELNLSNVSKIFNHFSVTCLITG